MEQIEKELQEEKSKKEKAKFHELPKPKEYIVSGKNLVNSENCGRHLSYALMMNPKVKTETTESTRKSDFRSALKQKVTNLISMI